MTAPVPLIIPEYAVDVLFPPVVRVAAPRMTLPPVVPPPAREPIVLLKPVISKIADASFAMVIAEPLPKACVTIPALSVPKLTVVAPV